VVAIGRGCDLYRCRHTLGHTDGEGGQTGGLAGWQSHTRGGGRWRGWTYSVLGKQVGFSARSRRRDLGFFPSCVKNRRAGTRTGKADEWFSRSTLPRCLVNHVSFRARATAGWLNTGATCGATKTTQGHKQKTPSLALTRPALPVPMYTDA